MDTRASQLEGERQKSAEMQMQTLLKMKEVMSRAVSPACVVFLGDPAAHWTLDQATQLISAPAAPFGKSSVPLASSEWSCEYCTTVNRSSGDVCEACHSVRPDQEKKTNTSSRPWFESVIEASTARDHVVPDESDEPSVVAINVSSSEAKLPVSDSFWEDARREISGGNEQEAAAEAKEGKDPPQAATSLHEQGTDQGSSPVPTEENLIPAKGPQTDATPEDAPHGAPPGGTPHAAPPGEASQTETSVSPQ